MSTINKMFFRSKNRSLTCDLKALLPASVLGGVVILMLTGLYLFAIFRHVPFLQHEMLGIAHWWTRGDAFWSILFDGSKMDSYPGRFRYLEYLFEAVYWKLTASGFLPKDLYDYLAIMVNLTSAFVMAKIGRQKGLNARDTGICVVLFLFSSQSIMTSIFHFRKAKYLVTFLLLLLVWLRNHSALEVRFRKGLWIVVICLGVLTDPYFILMAPILIICLEFCSKIKIKHLFRTSLLGFLLGALGILILNGLIGPLFSQNSQLHLSALQGVPGTMLKMQNVFSSHQILGFLVFPGGSEFVLLILSSMLFVALTVIALWILWKVGGSHAGYVLSFLFILPLNAFLILPSVKLGFYSGYYGQPILALGVLALMDVLGFCNRFELRFQRGGFIVVCLVILLHQIQIPKVTKQWQEVYCDSPRIQEKVNVDYAKLKEIRSYLNSISNVPYLLTLDSKNIKVLRPMYGTYAEDEGKLKYTDLAYLGYQVFFNDAMKQGKLKIIVD